MTEFAHVPDGRWLAAVALAAMAIVGTSHAFARGPRGAAVRVAGATLRLLAIAILGVCLLEPRRVEKVLHPHRVRLALLLDTSRSMATADVRGGRLAVARDWANAHLLRGLPAGVEVVPLAFGDRVSPATNLAALGATGSATAIAGALSSVLAAPGEDPLTGVVLLSDGIETAGQSPESIARQFKRRGIPVHTVGVGTTNETRDVVLEQVVVKRAVANEAPTRVALRLRSPGFGGSNVVVQIRRGREVQAAKAIRLNGTTQAADIEFVPRGKGFQVFEVAVAPQPGEWLEANNRRQFGIEVVDPTLRVLYMEGTPQQAESPMPEWKYLKDALQSDRNIKVKVLYRQFGNNGRLLNTADTDPATGERVYPVEHPTEGFPKTLEQLLEYDVVIHSDIRRDSFDVGQLDNMAKLVEQHGGGFVMIGGNSAFGRGGYHQTVLDRIIPIAMEGASDNVASPVRLQVPPNAWTHPLVAIGVDAADTRRIWTERFPTLYGYNRVERAKPGATVLGTGDDDVVLLAVQEVGHGRTMAFTSDTTRSWGRDFETLWGEPIRRDQALDESNCDSRHYRSFWVNAVRWLAAGKAGRTNQPVVLELSEGHAQPGDPLAANIRVRDTAQHDVATAEVSLFLSGGGVTNQPVGTARYDAASRSYRANLVVPPAGTHVVAARAALRGSPLGEDRELLVSEFVDREISDLRARPDVMEGIARASGGESFSAASDPGDALRKVLAGVPPPTEEFRRTPLWDKPAWLLAVLGLLSLEWSLRRWRGLA